MTTLALLKARIVDDFDNRSDLTTSIGYAINDAIEHYQSRRFWFNEARSVTFSTVASTYIYTPSTDVITIDTATILVGTDKRTLDPIAPETVEIWTDQSALSGEPYSYAKYGGDIWLYPVPTDAWTVRLVGHIKVDAPATDDEADNVWMTEAFELIRCAAKAYIALHKLRDVELAQTMAIAEQRALSRLQGKSAEKTGVGRIKGSMY